MIVEAAPAWCRPARWHGNPIVNPETRAMTEPVPERAVQTASACYDRGLCTASVSPRKANRLNRRSRRAGRTAVSSQQARACSATTSAMATGRSLTVDAAIGTSLQRYCPPSPVPPVSTLQLGNTLNVADAGPTPIATIPGDGFHRFGAGRRFGG